MNRESRRKSKQSTAPKKIKYATFMSYVASIIDLYQQQVRSYANSYPHPRSAVKELIDLVHKREEDHRRENYDDRALGTLIDGYTNTDQIADVVDYYMSKNEGVHLRNAVAFLLSHYCLLRSESARKATLPDMHSVQLEREGPSPCHALMMIIKQGKTNKHGRLEIVACLRNTRVEICPFMALAFYFFHRWQIENEPFPTFTRNQDWYDIRLLKSTAASATNTTEISYQQQLRAIDDAFTKCNIVSSKKTHAARGSSCKMADLDGADESQIRRLGRWNNTTMNGAYLTSLPREVMRVLAGFPSQQGHFFLPRAAVAPPPELCAKVFPQVDYWLEKIEPSQIAAAGFLRLLGVLRVTFLQDAVLMQEKYPRHPVFHSQIFQDPLYQEFKR